MNEFKYIVFGDIQYIYIYIITDEIYTGDALPLAESTGAA